MVLIYCVVVKEEEEEWNGEGKTGVVTVCGRETGKQGKKLNVAILW